MGREGRPSRGGRRARQGHPSRIGAWQGALRFEGGSRGVDRGGRIRDDDRQGERWLTRHAEGAGRRDHRTGRIFQMRSQMRGGMRSAEAVQEEREENEQSGGNPGSGTTSAGSNRPRRVGSRPPPRRPRSMGSTDHRLPPAVVCRSFCASSFELRACGSKAVAGIGSCARARSCLPWSRATGPNIPPDRKHTTREVVRRLGLDRWASVFLRPIPVVIE